MKKVLKTIVGIMCMVVIFTGCANTNNQNQNQGNVNNISQNNAGQNNTSKDNNNQKADDEKWQFDESKVIANDILTGEKLNYKHELTGLSEDGKTFKLNVFPSSDSPVNSCL